MDVFTGRRAALYFLLLCALVAPLPVLDARAAPAAQAVDLCVDGPLTTGRRFTSTLTMPAGEYSADCTLLIVEEVTLSVASGVTIRFGENGSLQNSGRLVVLGGSAGDVTFTSDAGVQAEGQWRGLSIDDEGSAALSGLAMRYAGRGGASAISAYGPISMTNVTVSDTENEGIVLRGVNAMFDGVTLERIQGNGMEVLANRDELVTVTIRNSVFEGIQEAAVEADPNLQLEISGNQVREAGLAGVALRSGSIKQAQTWRGGDMPYVIDGSLRVEAPMTIEAATILKFQDSASLTSREGGGFDVAGTEEAPVFFTTITDDEACLFVGDASPRIDCDTGNDGDKPQEPGAWNRVLIDEGSVAGSFQHARFRFGEYGMLSVEVPGYVIEHSVFEQAGRVGVLVSNLGGDVEEDFLTLRDSEIRGSGEVGLQVDLRGAARLVLENNRFVDNKVAVDSDADIELVVSGNTSEGEGLNGYRLSGDMSRAHTWRAGDLPFVPASEISLLNAGTVLTVEAGAVIKAEEHGAIDVGRGQLLMGSLDGEPVLVTSVEDDACSAAQDSGCDTNGDGGNSEGEAGDWRQIQIPNSSRGAVLHNVELRYGGALGAPLIVIESSDVEVRGSAIHHGERHGIAIELAQPLIENNDIHSNGLGNQGGSGLRIISGQQELQVEFSLNRIYNNEGGAVEIDANVELVLDGTNSTDEPAGFDAEPRNDQLNGIIVAGTVTQNVSWRAGRLPFVLLKAVSVESQSTLTLEPGVLLKFGEGGRLLIRSGVVEATGSESQPIILTSVADPVGGETLRNVGSPRKGDWEGIEFGEPGVSGRTVSLDYVEVRYAGADESPAIEVKQDSVEIKNARIFEVAGDGIHIDDAEGVLIEGSTIEEALGDGIRVETNQGLTVSVNGNTIRGAANALHIDGDVQLLSSENIVENNALNGVLVAGEISKIRTWFAGDLIWVLDERVEIDRGALTVEAGAVVKGTLDAELTLSNGSLTLDAPVDGPGIVVTSIADDTCGELAQDETCDTDGVDQTPRAGDWRGLDLDSSGDSATLRNVSLRYAGGTGADAALDVRVPRGVIIEHSEILESGTHGVQFADAVGARIQGNEFVDNRGAGLYLGRNASAQVVSNIFIGNARPLEVHTKLDVETAGNVSVGNVNDAMLFSEDVTESQSWTNDFVRDIDEVVTVDADLTVEPGSLLRFTRNAGLEVEGDLEARGVVFTSELFEAEAGHWRGLSFEGSAEGSVRHSTFAFGGSSTRGAVHMSVDGQIPIQYNHFLRSGGSAISASGDRIDPLIEGNVIRDVVGRTSTGVKLSGPSRGGGERSLIRSNFIANAMTGIELTRKNAQLLFNHLGGVLESGIINRTSNLCIEAENNWWGNEDGPEDDHEEDANEPCGEDRNPSDGAAVSKYVKWAPHLAVAPPELPILDLPRSGSTNQTEITVAGRGGKGDELLIFDADAVDPIGRVTIGSDGRFETTVSLSSGAHELSVATEKEVEGIGQPLRSARLGFRLVVVDPSSVVDPATIAFVYGNRTGPQIQPLRDVTGAAPACGGQGSGRVVLPKGVEVVVRAAAQGGPGSVEFVQEGSAREMRLGGSGFYESEAFQPEQGSFMIRADGDDGAACRGFIFLGGAGTVFSDQGAPSNPVLVSDFEGEFGSNDGWLREQPWAPTDGDSSTGQWSMATGEYEASINASLTLAEEIDLSTMVAPEIRFDTRYEFGRGDEGAIDIQTEPDGRWSEVVDFSGSRSDWHGVTVSLDEYALETRVRLRFRLRSNSDDQVGEGWWLDDVRIQSGGESNDRLDEGEPVVAGAEILLSMVSPETGQMIRWDGSATGQFNPQITDDSGRFAFFGLPPGQYRLQITPPAGSGLQPFYTNPPYVIVDGTLAIDVPLSEAGAIYLPLVSRNSQVR